MNNIKIIGFTGKLQSGKTTSANFIKDNIYLGAIKLSFSDLLKNMILEAGLCTKEELWEKKTDFSRLMLQKIGTEIIRNQVSQDFWVDKMHETISKIVNNQKDCNDFRFIIDDVRFLNEVEIIEIYNGNMIRIIRPSLLQNKTENLHKSEIEQDSIIANYEIFNDGSIIDLQHKLVDVLNIIRKDQKF